MNVFLSVYHELIYLSQSIMQKHQQKINSITNKINQQSQLVNFKSNRPEISGSITCKLGAPKDYDSANSEDMEKHSANTLKWAVSQGLTLAPKTSVGSLTKAELNAREQTGSITNTAHNPDGYTHGS